MLVCDDSLRDLQGFRRRSHYKAGRGGHGEGALRHGADGETLAIAVPPGTEIVAPEGQGGDLEGRRWELLQAGQRATVARGGGGGKGNKRFANPTRQSPRFAERGLSGEEGWLELRLKLLADVGLVGLPNAGKSSLLSRLTRADPKVASYPFTTLSPVLGVLDDGERQLVLADIPGLIEGASEGAGLGHDFLAHVERTRLLVHVLDIAPELSLGEQADAIANHATIERELRAHDARLATLPRVLALSKADLVPRELTRSLVAEWQARLGPEVPVIATSSATREGLAELSNELLRRVGPAAPAELPGERASPDEGARAGGRSSSPSTSCFARLPPPAFGLSASARRASRSAAAASSDCSNATTSRTRTRWPTSRGGCAGSGCSGRSRPRASSRVMRSRSAGSRSSWTPRTRLEPESAAERLGSVSL